MRRAAEEYQVPCSTLHDRGSGKVHFGAKSGPARYLNYQEESKLVNFLCCCTKIGYARTWLQVLVLVQQVIKDKGLDVKVTIGWWDSFRRRHTEVKLQTA